MKRRTFLQSSMAVPAVIMSAGDVFPVKTNLQVKILDSNWGFSGKKEEF